MNTIDTKLLEEILPTVSRPGRYIGNEWNIIKKDLDKAAVKFALAFPDIYDIGMSYLGLRIIYGVLNSREDIACERVFAPWRDFEDKLRQNKMPLFSLESKTPVKEFDILGFSLTYELNYTNVLNMLDLANIPLRSKDRDSSFPLVIAGGPAAFNPVPMEEFIDAFVVGEGEEVILEIIDVYKSQITNYKSQTNPKLQKDKLLMELANLEGVYVPTFPKEVKKRIVKDLDLAFYPTKEMVPNVQIIHDRITLEVMRGCPFSCKFCQASSFYRPLRIKSQEKVLELARSIYSATGYDEFSLLSLSSGDYPGVVSLVSRLVDEFKELGVGVSLPSLRSDDILKSLPALIVKMRKTGLTFAPEAGTERLRRHINKNIDVEKIVSACEEAFKLGWRLVKLYFMIGLPTETNEDLEGIASFINRILKLKKDIKISVSINAFVPKAHTDFESEKIDTIETLIDKQRFIKLRVNDKRVKLKFHDANISVLEAQFNRPDRRLSEVIYAAWKNGARFDSWSECFSFDIWRAAFNQSGIELN